MDPAEQDELFSRLPVSQRVYDSCALILLMWPAAAGTWLVGSTRTWAYAPGLILSFLGSLLVIARPLVFRNTPRTLSLPGFWCFALLGIYLVERVPFSLVPYASRWDALRWVCLLAAAWSWPVMGARPHRWKWLLGILLMAVAFNALYAWVQQVNGSDSVLWAPRPEQYGMRASGPFLCPNHFANLMAMIFPMAVLLLFMSDAGLPLRLMAGYFLVICAPVLYWTQSRSGWAGAMAGLMVSALLLAMRKSRTWFAMALIILPLLAAAVGSAAWMTLPDVRTRIGAVLEDPIEAGGVRFEMWSDAPAMLRDRPVAGFGGGTYVWAYPPYQRHVKQHLNFDFVHNEYIQVLLEHGLIGGALALAGLLAALWGLSRAVYISRSQTPAWLLAGAVGGFVASLVHALFDFNFHIFPNPHALLWLIGVSWGVWVARESPLCVTTSLRIRFRQAGAVAGVLVCLAGIWFSLIGLMSYVWDLKGEIARTNMDQEDAESAYRKSIAWDGANWRPYLGLGHLRAAQAMWFRRPDVDEEKAGKKKLAGEAAEFFRSSIERNPAEMAAEFGLARACNVMGDSEKALEHYRRAAEYQRRHIFYREQLGIQLRRMGYTEEAMAVFQKNMDDGVATDVSRLNLNSMKRQQARDAAAANADASGTAP